MSPRPKPSLIDRLIRFCLENRLVVVLATIVLILWGAMVAPFDWEFEHLPRDPVPVDAIPDIGENQQIVFTEWMGRSPQDIEDQVTYPLTTALLGLPAVKTIRSYSMFGFSSIYIIFKEEVEFYWARSRILEKLNSLPSGTLPIGVQPQLGPDATALGQVFWYTLEGLNPAGEPAGGWDLDELRSAQDWYVRYALQGVDGVAEVASIGGFVKEYQIDVDPDALRTYGIALHEVFNAVRGSNLDVGARTIEINRVEYVIRGLGFIEDLDDLRRTVITERDNVPITLDRVAQIEFGPALRRGALDKAGAEAVGGVVVTRFGENPLAVIKRVKAKIAEISPGLPRKTLEDGTVSQVRIVPFYDRTALIYETLGTLEDAVRQQILVTIIVVIIMVMHLRSAALISGVLPLAVLFSFIGMKTFGVDANVVALSGIAIAIGTIVDMGVVLIENILKHLDEAPPEESRLEVVYRACSEVAGAVVTAVLTTVVSFLPVFTMEAAEGKLFRPAGLYQDVCADRFDCRRPDHHPAAGPLVYLREAQDRLVESRLVGWSGRHRGIGIDFPPLVPLVAGGLHGRRRRFPSLQPAVAANSPAWHTDRIQLRRGHPDGFHPGRGLEAAWTRSAPAEHRLCFPRRWGTPGPLLPLHPLLRCDPDCCPAREASLPPWRRPDHTFRVHRLAGVGNGVWLDAGGVEAIAAVCCDGSPVSGPR